MSKKSVGDDDLSADRSSKQSRDIPMPNKGRLPVCASSIGVSREGKVFPIRCGSWNCGTCAALNALEHAIRVVNGIKAYQADGIKVQYVTLTQPATLYGKHAWLVLFDQWQKLYNRFDYIRRKNGAPKLEYAAFVESQSREVPHMHAVAVFLPIESKRDLRLNAAKSGFGVQADYQVLDGAAVGWYIAKYATKQSSALGMPKGFRRVRYSQGFPKALERAPSDCVVMKQSETIRDFVARATRFACTSSRDIEYKVIVWLGAAREGEPYHAIVEELGG